MTYILDETDITNAVNKLFDSQDLPMWWVRGVHTLAGELKRVAKERRKNKKEANDHE